jgi:hypothetical protein
MPKLGMRLITLAKPCILTVALALPIAISAVPAHAQAMLKGLFRLFRAFSQPAALPLPSQLFGYLPNPALEQLRRKARPLVEE